MVIITDSSTYIRTDIRTDISTDIRTYIRTDITTYITTAISTNITTISLNYFERQGQAGKGRTGSQYSEELDPYFLQVGTGRSRGICWGFSYLWGIRVSAGYLGIF